MRDHIGVVEMAFAFGGAVLAEGPYAEVSANPQVIEAYMGTAHG